MGGYMSAAGVVGDKGVQSCMSIYVSLCHTLPCIRRPLDDGVVPVSGVFLFNVLISECVCVSPHPFVLDVELLRCTATAQGLHSVSMSAWYSFGAFLISLVNLDPVILCRRGDVLFLPDRMTLPLFFLPLRLMQRCVCVLAGSRRGPAWLRNALRLDACVA